MLFKSKYSEGRRQSTSVSTMGSRSLATKRNAQAGKAASPVPHKQSWKNNLNLGATVAFHHLIPHIAIKGYIYMAKQTGMKVLYILSMTLLLWLNDFTTILANIAFGT